jgi:hypothetical protein
VLQIVFPNGRTPCKQSHESGCLLCHVMGGLPRWTAATRTSSRSERIPTESYAHVPYHASIYFLTLPTTAHVSSYARIRFLKRDAHPQVDRCYKDLKPVGKGSYGIVCSSIITCYPSFKSATPVPFEGWYKSVGPKILFFG